ncbi:MAG: PD-(D/E)XK nuclease domain-containing protein [Bacteroidia bacterium]
MKIPSNSFPTSDWPGFDEKHLKTMLVAYFYSVGIYHIQSEPEMEQRYPDLILRSRPPYEPPYQFMIELKYIKKQKPDEVEAKIQKGREQLKRYLQAEESAGVEEFEGLVVGICGDGGCFGGGGRLRIVVC